MKKLISFVLMLILLSAVTAALPENVQRKLTVMVYMCGSNLETYHGSASKDLKEMMSAEIGEDVSVLAMVGGSEFWDLDYDTDYTHIVEIGRGEQQIVWMNEKINMGEPETLVRLLTWAQENRPAEEYALILWDHGGGPVEGVCWDELFDLDHLSLAELTGAIRSAGFSKKLKWIGFDACLMCSLEVADGLSPYAEYMIASQETEPAFGWNYSFLNGTENDATGGETGKRIIDTYFEGHEDYRDVMTLSCLDLSGAEAAKAELDAFFASAAASVRPETFSEISNLRKNVTGFGNPARAAGENGYDLVDARGLIRALGKDNRETEKLLDRLDSLVVCSRSNQEGPEGVSLYHPYMNKESYVEEWRDAYRELHFSENYTDYISAFGDVLTGLEITDWSGLPGMTADITADRTDMFTLQLTPEQQENFASAQLLILYDYGTRGELDEQCLIVYTGRTEMNEAGMLTAEYAGQSLYIEKEDGSLYGPVAFNLTDDGKYAYIEMLYMPEDTGDTAQRTYVLYYLETDGITRYPEIVRTRIWDPATETFTNRVSFDESEYDYLYMVEIGKILPETDERGLLPGYYDWEDGDIPMFTGAEINLPNEWRFRWMDDPITASQMHAVFQVTDVQQNTFCSPPVPVPNPFRRDCSGTPDETAGSEPGFGMNLTVVDSPTERGVEVYITMDNPTREKTSYSFSRLLINGERVSRLSPLSAETEASEDSCYTLCRMSAAEFHGIDRIEEIRTIVTVRRESGTTMVPVQIRFEDCSVRSLWEDMIPLAEAEQDNAMVQLISLKPYGSDGMEALLMITNDSSVEIKVENSAVIGKTELKSYADTQEIPAGTSSLNCIHMFNSVSASGYLATAEEEPYFYETSISDHILQHEGIYDIQEMTIYLSPDRGNYREAFCLKLYEPWELRDGEMQHDLNTSMKFRDPSETPDQEETAVLLAENNQYSVACKKLLAGKNGIAMKLEICNKTEVPLILYAKNGRLDGVPVRCDEYSETKTWTVAPGAVTYSELVLCEKTEEATLAELHTAEAGFISKEQQDQGQEAASCTISFPEPPEMGTARALWISTDRIEVQKAQTPDVKTEPEDTAREQNADPGTEQLFDSELVVADSALDQIRWISAGLSAEQTARAKGGIMWIVRLAEDGSGTQLFAACPVRRGKDGQIGCRCPGVILAAENAPDAGILQFQTWQDEQHLSIETAIGLNGNDKGSNPVQKLENVKAAVDYENNRAEITGAVITETEETEPVLTDGPRLMQWVLITPYTKALPDAAEDPFMPILNRKTIAAYPRMADLNGKPFRMILRPIKEEDQLYCIFDIMEEDGTEYTLPMIPYPAE